jgi:hypothetical protein
MSWQNILKTAQSELDKLLEEYIQSKKELDEQYEKDYLKLRERLMEDNIMSIDSSRDLRRKNPITRRKRMPVAEGRPSLMNKPYEPKGD